MNVIGTEYGGRWTRTKLSILEEYLSAYTTALKDRPFQLIYVDAFAGSGFWMPRSEDPWDDPAEFRKMWRGSAPIALAIDDKPFDRLLFIEKDEGRYKSLQQLRRDHVGRKSM